MWSPLLCLLGLVAERGSVLRKLWRCPNAEMCGGEGERKDPKKKREERKVRLDSVSVVQVEGFDERRRAHGGGAEHPD